MFVYWLILKKPLHRMTSKCQTFLFIVLSFKSLNHLSDIIYRENEIHRDS